MINSKRAQSEIITTVLIILLVLAAIIIVWQVVSSTIEEGEKGIDLTSQCIGIDVAMVKAGIASSGNKGNVTLRRDSNEPDGKNVTVIILVNGARIEETTSLARFGSQQVILNHVNDPTLVANDEISVAYSIDGEACPNEPEVLGKVTA